jgi:N-acetylmuramoyl-L-alanine amidase
MKPEPVPQPSPDRRRTIVDWLALALLAMAADQDVRVFEALAATLVRQAHQARQDLASVLKELPCTPFPGLAAVDDFSRKLELCRRIARRALHGSLLDPAPGATAFHRIGQSPAWASNRLPIAVIGSFLFYDLADLEHIGDANADGEIAVDTG